MESSGFLSSLSLMTMAAVIVVAVIAYLYFLRSKPNREAAKRTHGLED